MKLYFWSLCFLLYALGTFGFGVWIISCSTLPFVGYGLALCMFAVSGVSGWMSADAYKHRL